MPLREAEREVMSSQANRDLLAQSSERSPEWVETINRLWFRRGQIARWAALGLIVSVVLAWRLPKYESTVQIMPPDNAASGLAALALPALSKTPSLGGLAGDLMGGKTTGAVFIKVLESRTIQDDLIGRFNLRRRNFNKYSEYLEDARSRLGSRTTITEDKKSGVIAVSVRDHDPGLATALANAYVDELDKVMAKVSTSAARRERIFIEQRLIEETQNLEAAEQKFSQFASANMALDVPQQTRVTVEAAARLQGELIAVRGQLEAAKQLYTADNIKVKSIQAHVNELERELGKINSGKSVTAAGLDQSSPYPSVRKLPILGVRWADLYRDTKTHETVVELLTQQYELSRIQEAKEIATVKVLDPASSPEMRYPKPMTIVVVGAVLSVVLACFGVWLHDRWEMWNEEDPRRILLVRIFRGSRAGISSITGMFGRRRAHSPDHRMS
jgi:uncharacterized protein involved in exopolysaccharide biosynthesis